LPWIALNSLSLDAYIEVTQQIPLGRVVMNTILPVLATLLLVQLPIAYLSALGIGALRPLGQWSDWLLLPFSPWLFVTVGPLSLVLWQGLRESGQLNTWIALAPPVLVSVPMLFILALFFKGQAPRWQAAQVEGQSAASAFWHQLILPSLPLAALLACITLFIGLQELLWPLLAVTDREYFTINLTLALIQSSFTLDWPVITAALTLFWLPNFIIFFLIFAAFQVLYLGRLALTTGR
jgi:ABC-type glycerol-3-phosphate transport system permease component